MMVYYWPTLRKDSAEFFRRCDKCKEHFNLHHASPDILHFVMSPWSFYHWAVDILGHFPLVYGQLRFLIVGVDYFTNWIEEEVDSRIAMERVRHF